jgi:hypothetical protein
MATNSVCRQKRYEAAMLGFRGLQAYLDLSLPFCIILGAFAKQFQNSTLCFIISVCPPVFMACCVYGQYIAVIGYRN